MYFLILLPATTGIVLMYCFTTNNMQIDDFPRVKILASLSLLALLIYHIPEKALHQIENILIDVWLKKNPTDDDIVKTIFMSLGVILGLLVFYLGSSLTVRRIFEMLSSIVSFFTQNKKDIQNLVFFLCYPLLIGASTLYAGFLYLLFIIAWFVYLISFLFMNIGSKK